MYGRKKEFDNTNSGALFQRQKRSDSSPDVGGEIELGGDVLDYVIRCAENGKPVKLELAGWRKSGRSGPFTSLKVNTPYEERGGGQRTRNYREDPPRRESNVTRFRKEDDMFQERLDERRDQRAEGANKRRVENDFYDDEVPF